MNYPIPLYKRTYIVDVHMVELSLRHYGTWLLMNFSPSQFQWYMGPRLCDASELRQNALSSIQTMLSTNKRLIGMRTLTLFKKPIPLKSKVKYLGVHKDNK